MELPPALLPLLRRLHLDVAHVTRGTLAALRRCRRLRALEVAHCTWAGGDDDSSSSDSEGDLSDDDADDGDGAFSPQEHAAAVSGQRLPACTACSSGSDSDGGEGEDAVRVERATGAARAGAHRHFAWAGGVGGTTAAAAAAAAAAARQAPWVAHRSPALVPDDGAEGGAAPRAASWRPLPQLQSLHVCWSTCRVPPWAVRGLLALAARATELRADAYGPHGELALAAMPRLARFTCLCLWENDAAACVAAALRHPALRHVALQYAPPAWGEHRGEMCR